MVTFRNVYVWTEGQNGRKQLHSKTYARGRKAKTEGYGYVSNFFTRVDGGPKRKKIVIFKNVCVWTEGQNGRIWLRFKFFYTCGRRAKTEENSYIQKRLRVDGRPKRKDMVTFENLYVWTGGPKRKKIVTFKNVCVWTGSQKGRK